MEKKDAGDGFIALKFVQNDLKKHLCKLSNFMVVGIKYNRTMAYDVNFMVSYIRHFSNHIGCNESYINDPDRDLKELMVSMDIIKDNVLNLARMDQYSHFQDSLGKEAQPMEDI